MGLLGGLFSPGGTKLPKWAKPAVQQGLATAGNVFNENQANLTSLSGMASDAFKAAAPGAFGPNPYIDNAKDAAGAIGTGAFLGSNPGQGTYDRMQRAGGQGLGGMKVAQPIGGMSRSGGQSMMGGDPSMGLLSHFATAPNSTAPNPADGFASGVAGGQYLNHQPSAGMYDQMMDQSYSTANPFLDDIIRQNDENVTTQANRMFGARGMGAGIGSAYADVLSKNLANTGGQLRYQNYSDAENRRLQAGGQSDAAFGAERSRMGEATGLLANDFNTANAQRLSAAQSLGGQYNQGQDRALEAAKAGDAAQANQVQQMLQALGLTGQIENAGYAGYAPTTDLLKTAATLPYLGLDAYQSALSNLAGTAKQQSGPGLGYSMWTSAAQGAGSAAAASERRLKTNIEKVGTFDDGLNVYDFDYVWGGPRQRGVMVDEVEKLRPWALGPITSEGYRTVDYSKLEAA